MIGNAHLQYHPTFFDDNQSLLMTKNGDRKESVRRRNQSSSKGHKSKKKRECDPEEVELADYPQWQDERGYWIGEYTFLNGDGNPNTSASWNYPYDHYKGFITGEVEGNAYRQRNVFLYPPQTDDVCNDTDNASTGEGVCGSNGNSKIFKADQSATTCSKNEELAGDIEGPYIQGPFSLPTKTQLVGDNAVLYQVFIPGAMVGADADRLYQSQLTTFSKNPSTGQLYRTRTAQGFDAFALVGVSTFASYYRERKVDETEFYTALANAIEAYSINDGDLCTWDNGGNPIANATGSFETCKDHLEQSFALGEE